MTRGVDGAPAEAARAILLAAIRAVSPRELTAHALRRGAAYHVPRSVDVIAVGKAAVAMAQGAGDVLGDALRGGVVIAPGAAGALPPGVALFAGGHPMPNQEGVRGAEAVAQLLAGAGPGARVLVLVSGGASSLMTFPVEPLSLGDVVETSRALMAAGADIRELNCVRKHLDRLKGGRMAKMSAGATLHGLVLSDVIGDPLDVIASGPLVPDPTTYADAMRVLHERAVWNAVPAAVRAYLAAGGRGEHRETPKPGDRAFDGVDVEVIGNNALAVQGAAREARRLGFDVEFVDAPVSGEARDAGERFARRAMEAWSREDNAAPRCVIGGGETTVTVVGSGVGGRNLEFAAAAAVVIDGAEGVVVGSVGTDGLDGPTDAAGAVVDGETAVRARAAHLELIDRLRDNDTLRALDAAGAVMRTGATGTNVMDVQLAIIARP